MGLGGRWQALRSQLHHRPVLDKSNVGVVFVDVLFALVVGEVLTPLKQPEELTSAAIMHLVVALVLTLGSWVGYHTSVNRPRFVIRFVNLPLWQFLLDVLMVLAYWLVATRAEIGAHPEPSAVPEAFLVLVSFCLYALWDQAGARLWGTPEYQDAWRADQGADPPPMRPARMRVTRIWTLISAGMFAGALVVEMTSRAGTAPRVWMVIIFDAALVVSLVGYRIAKEWVRPPATAAS